jgi:hypothetical protein
MVPNSLHSDKSNSVSDVRSPKDVGMPLRFFLWHGQVIEVICMFDRIALAMKLSMQLYLILTAKPSLLIAIALESTTKYTTENFMASEFTTQARKKMLESFPHSN